jgi:hypothetical protein
MRREWWRDHTTSRPSRLPTYTIALFIFSILTVAGVWYSRYVRVWTPLERHYLSAYVRGQIAGMFRDNGWYTLLQIVTRKDTRLALDDDVVPAVTESGENTFALTKEAAKQGALRLELHRAYYNNAQMHAYLANWIYQDQTIIDLVRPALWGGLVVFLVGLWPVALLERQRTSELRNGRRLRVPQSMALPRSNRTHHSSGVGLGNEKQPLLERMLGTVKKLSRPRNKKNGHVLFTGNTTTGETRPVEQVREAFPQEPPQTVAAAAPADVSLKSNGTHAKPAATERKTTQEQKIEHGVTRVSKHFFE